MSFRRFLGARIVKNETLKLRGFRLKHCCMIQIRNGWWKTEVGSEPWKHHVQQVLVVMFLRFIPASIICSSRTTHPRKMRFNQLLGSLVFRLAFKTRQVAWDFWCHFCWFHGMTHRCFGSTFELGWVVRPPIYPSMIHVVSICCTKFGGFHLRNSIDFKAGNIRQLLYK